MKKITLIEHGIILTMNEQMDIIYDGAVAVQDQTILEVGTTKELHDKYNTCEKIIDATNCIVMPGLINMHNHTYDCYGLVSKRDMYDQIMEEYYPSLQNITYEEAYWMAMRSYCMSLRSGITTTNNIFVQMEACGNAALDTGIRASLACEVCDNLPVGKKEVATLAENLSLFHEFHGKKDGRIQVMLGLDWIPGASLDMIKEMSKQAKELQCGIHMHLNESMSEIDFSVKKWGKRPVQIMDEVGIFDVPCLAAHCVWMSSDEIDFLKEKNVAVAYNPTSNALLGNSLPRIKDMREMGIKVGIGNDGLEQDLWKVIGTTAMLQRAVHRDAMLMDEKDVIKMATCEAAEGLHLNTGRLKAGMLADLILVNTDNERYLSLLHGENTNIYFYLVHNTCAQDIVTTMVDGKLVMEDRKLQDIDLEKVISQTKIKYHEMLKRDYA